MFVPEKAVNDILYMILRSCQVSINFVTDYVSKNLGKQPGNKCR